MSTAAREKQNGPQDAAQVAEPLASIIAQAADEGATDIHVDEGGTGSFCVRFRVDGMIHAKHEMTPGQARRLINQIKVAADISLEGLFTPVEGQIRWHLGERSRDIRVTVIPEGTGSEAAHLRLLTTAADWRDVQALGLRDHDLRLIERVMKNPHGLILIAGPNGAGKSTTMQALLRLSDLRQQVAGSIEEPVEFDLPFVRQLEVRPRRGMTMEEGLRTLLRMDLDTLLVGEIRDRDSAAIAAQAALSGRLVMATVHGRDTAGAIQAMHYLSVPYHVLGGALRLVMAQNLIRRLCRSCAVARRIERFEKKLFERAGFAWPEQVMEPVGCRNCNGYGYRGRTGIFEVMGIDDECGLWLSAGPHQQELRLRLTESGARPLSADALLKVADGTTSMREVLRFFGDGVDRPLAAQPLATEIARRPASQPVTAFVPQV